MPITINTYCRVNRNGSININTDPAFGFTTSTTTTTTTFNINNYACVEVGGDEPSEMNGTYVVTGTSTVDGVTRPIYTNTNGLGCTMQITSFSGGPVWAFFINGNPIYLSTSQPAPAYAWQATGYAFDLRRLTQGPC
jgi:hypothetical protein